MDGQSGMAAIVLAGGQARRFGGADKLGQSVSGRALLDRVLAAAAEAEPRVVVGPPRATRLPVRWTREEPPGGGPVAAIGAGLRLVPGSAVLVAVLAGDHAHLRPRTLARLRAAVERRPDAAGAVLADPDGRAQWLLGVWRGRRLRAAVPEEGAGRSVRSVLGELDPLLVPAAGREASDVDTPEDLRRSRR
ncbi:molybdenum cofactor guanylyltransferase [Salinifilum ghardaiensis]